MYGKVGSASRQGRIEEGDARGKIGDAGTRKHAAHERLSIQGVGQVVHTIGSLQAYDLSIGLGMYKNVCCGIGGTTIGVGEKIGKVVWSPCTRDPGPEPGGSVEIILQSGAGEGSSRPGGGSDQESRVFLANPIRYHTHRELWQRIDGNIA